MLYCRTKSADLKNGQEKHKYITFNTTNLSQDKLVGECKGEATHAMQLDRTLTIYLKSGQMLLLEVSDGCSFCVHFFINSFLSVLSIGHCCHDGRMVQSTQRNHSRKEIVNISTCSTSVFFMQTRNYVHKVT